MEMQGWVIVYGGVAAVVALIIGGIHLGGWIGGALLVAGIVGALAWLVFMFELLSAFNSDI